MKNSKNSNLYITHDISIAAWLLMNGMNLTRAEKSSGKYIFEFKDDTQQAQTLVLKFAGTEFAVYDSYLRTLRALIRT